MRKVYAYFKEQLFFSVSEAKSAVAFLVAIIFSLIAYFSYYFLSQSKASELAINQYGTEKLPDKKPQYENYKKSNFTNSYAKKNWDAKASKKFEFDPNTASEQQLNDLGFPKYVSSTIVKYRNKGGKFKFKEDLQKIYVLKPEIYQLMEPYITLPSKNQQISSDYAENKVITEDAIPVTFTPKPNNTSFKPKPEIKPFDINTADTTQLQELRGIGRVFAYKILKFRDALGGFKDIDQVSETYGLNPEVMDEIKKRTFVGKKIQLIKINSVESFKHPYLKPNQIKVVLNYRKQHGNFSSIEDFKQIKVLTEEDINNIKPYLDFN